MRNLKIGHRNFEIKYVKKIKNEKCDGIARLADNKIIIATHNENNEKLKEINLLETLIHEALHVVLFRVSFENLMSLRTKNIKDEELESLEEVIVETIVHGLIDIFYDNIELLDEIKRVLNKEKRWSDK